MSNGRSARWMAWRRRRRSARKRMAEAEGGVCSCGEAGGVGAEGLAELVVGIFGVDVGGGHCELPGVRKCLAFWRARKRSVRTLSRLRPVAEEISAWSMPST